MATNNEYVLTQRSRRGDEDYSTSGLTKEFGTEIRQWSEQPTQHHSAKFTSELSKEPRQSHPHYSPEFPDEIDERDDRR